MPTVTPFLWFESGLAEALEHYAGVFDDFEVLSRSVVDDGTVASVTFSVAGQTVAAIEGGPYQRLTPAFSLLVSCADQEEIDRCYDGLLAGGGEPLACGWLTDRHGVTWQVAPDDIGDLLGGDDPEASARVQAVMRPMQKLDVAALRAAYAG